MATTRPTRYDPRQVHAGAARQREAKALLDQRLELTYRELARLTGLSMAANEPQAKTEKLVQALRLLHEYREPEPSNLRKTPPREHYSPLPEKSYHPERDCPKGYTPPRPSEKEREAIEARILAHREASHA